MNITRPLSRATALIVGSAFLATSLAACGSGSSSTAAGSATRTVRIGIQDTGFNELALLLAASEGALDGAKIKIKTVQVTDLPSAVAALSKGDLDALAQNPAVLQKFNANTGGAKFQYFAPMQAFDCVILVAGDSNIPSMSPQTWQDTVRAFKGKKIGVPLVGGLVDLMLRSMAKQVGIVPDKDFKIVSVGVGAAAQAALKQKVVDAITDTTLGAQQAEDAGMKPVVDLIEGVGPDQFNRIWGSGYFAPITQLDKNASTYEALHKAASLGQAMLTDPAKKSAVINFLVDDLKIDRGTAEAIYPRLGAGLGMGLTEPEVSPAVSAYASLGLIGEPVPTYDDLVWKRAQQ